MKHIHRGVVLIWALITMAVTTTILGALGAYYVSVGRMANVYMDKTSNRFVGQHALESVKSQIQEILEANNIFKGTATPAMAVQSGSAFLSNLETAIGQIKNLIKSPVKNGDYEIRFSDANDTLDAIAKSGNGTLVLQAEVYGKTSAGSQRLMTLQEEIVFRTSGTEAITTMEIFDFVYFANNYGHLDSSVVANGDIGANDKFTINGSRVNGYVKIRGDIDGSAGAYDITDTWMWPYQSFMVRVANKIKSDMAELYPGFTITDKDYYTQVRPTNPIYVSETESPIEWSGGYEPPGFTSDYGDILATGGFATTPENKYASALAVYEKGYTNDAYSTYFDTQTGDALTNPSQTDYNKYYNDDGSPKINSLQADYETYYTPDGSNKTYPDQSTYLNYYNADGTAKAYTSADYSKYYNSDGTAINYYNTHSSYQTYYNADHTAKTNPDKATYLTYYYENGSAKSNPYSWFFNNKKWNEWNNNQKSWASGTDNYNRYTTWNNNQKNEGTAYATWESGRKAEADKVDTWTSTQSSVGSAHDTWVGAQSTMASNGEKAAYETWLADQVNWRSGGTELTAYNNWNATQTAIGKDYAQWASDYAETENNYNNWKNAYETWMKDYLNGKEEVQLTASTAHITDTASKKILNVTTHVVEVPNLSDTNINEYIEYCRTFTTNSSIGTKGGKLYCDNQYDLGTQKNIQMVLTNCYSKREITYRKRLIESDYTTDEDQTTAHSRTINKVQITNGDGTGFIPITNPSDSPFAKVSSLEVGSVILIGTDEHPITIEGPVYFPGDVVIRGFVKGQGTIYAGRNIHIIGDITYKTPPSWPHENLTLERNRPNAVKLRNAGSDILLLVARGNIIVGDYSSDLWQSDANMKYLKSYGAQSPNCNDFLESDIGYKSGFDRDYTQEDGGMTVDVSYSETTKKWNEYYLFVNYNYRKTTWTLNVTSQKRKYYESIFGAKVISELKQTMTTDPDQLYKLPTSFWQRLSDFFDTLLGNSTTKIEASKSPNDGDILEIDSVLFANHGIFGVVGGASTPQFTLNGAMLCRDEGLLPSFTERFKDLEGGVKQKIWLNWDMRIKSDSAEGLTGTGAPVSINSSNKAIEIFVKSWREVK